MSANYVPMNDEPQPAALYPFRIMKRRFKPKFKPWISMAAALCPLLIFERIIKYGENMHIYLPLHHIPICAFLLAEIVLGPISSSRTAVCVSIGIVACCLVLIVSVCYNHARPGQNVPLIAGLTYGSGLAGLIQEIWLIVWATRNCGNSFVWGLVGTSVITTAGLMGLSLGILAVGLPIEFVVRFLTGTLRPCIGQRHKIIRQMLPLTPIQFSRAGLDYATCPECLKPFNKGDMVVETGCGAMHMLHPTCLQRCSDSYSECGKCPVCWQNARPLG